MNALRTIRRSAMIGYAELPTTHNLRWWLSGWIVRLTFQVAFFTLLGRLAGSDDMAHAVLLGNATALVAVDAMFVTTTSAGELYQGTFPLLIASPTRVGVVYLGRAVHWVVTGIASCTVVFVTVSLAFSAPWHWWTVFTLLPVIALIGVSSYLYGCFAAALSLRNAKFRTFYSNVAFLLLATFCGVNVPVGYWPAPLRWCAQVLPLTHGLAAVRTAVAGGRVSTVLSDAALEAAVAALWAVVVLVLFERIAGRGRRDGSLSFAS